MRIGILSDTHDNLPNIEKAVKIFKRKKISLLLHAGDYIAPFSISPFKKLKCDYLGVFGNNDGEKEGLTKISEGRIKEGPLFIELESKKIALIHDLNKLDLKDEKYNLIICGHTHKPEIRKESSSLIINPGECSGWLYRRPTVAILDLETLSTNFFRL